MSQSNGGLPGFSMSNDESEVPVNRKPLAARMRPTRLAEVVGHQSLLGSEALLPRLIRSDNFGSIIFYGPPGCGKTTMAHVIAHETQSTVVRVNAVLSGTAELREILSAARNTPNRKTLLVIDEIHRFNKAQQDLLLPDVESGVVRLIGCTTHNPGLYVIPALLSRSHLFRLEPLAVHEVAGFLKTAMEDAKNGLGALKIKVEPRVLELVAELAAGDLRRALNYLETLVLSAPVMGAVTEDAVKVFTKERRIRYDDGGDDHYDTASAYIKSMRGGDPDAALYWLAVMLEGGEDPRFIARRLVILASEDIGLADSRALSVAVAAFQACEWVGMPECEYHLAHATLFLALAPKSNSVTTAIAAAKQAVLSQTRQEVPLHLKDSHTQAAKRLGQGQGYLYSHEYPEAISGQDYLSQPLSLYQPGQAGAEAQLAERLAQWKAIKQSIQKKGQGS